MNYSGETRAGGAYDGIRKSYTGFSAGENVPWKDTNESDRKKKDNELLGQLKGKFNWLSSLYKLWESGLKLQWRGLREQR